MLRITPARIADALDEAKRVARDHIIRTSDLNRNTREILRQTRWLREIIKGYYLLINPAAEDNETIVWQGAYWNFIAVYLDDRFGNTYVLSPENSLDILTRNTVMPAQVILQATTGGQGETRLPHGYSLFSYRVPDTRMPGVIESVEGLRVFPLELALARVGPSFFEKSAENAHIALRLADVSKLARHILGGDAPIAAADRLYHALIDAERTSDAERFSASLETGGIILLRQRATPVTKPKKSRPVSPYAERIKLMWATMHDDAKKALPKPPGQNKSKRAILKSIESTYTRDAYHSLSIEGCKVSDELIERVRRGAWNPEDLEIRHQIDAMAAKGYLEAFKSVENSIAKVIDGTHPATIAENDLPSWFSAMFKPSIEIGLLKAADLVGYRNKPVYIRNSRHVPPPHEALMDCMDTLFECLHAETHPGIGAVLGHFMFTFIHPFHDGNGRIGRFLMNLMLISGGYPWTIIRSDTQHRNKYLDALEKASVNREIAPFCKFITTEMAVDWS